MYLCILMLLQNLILGLQVSTETISLRQKSPETHYALFFLIFNPIMWLVPCKILTLLFLDCKWFSSYDFLLFFTSFDLFSKTALKKLPNFCMSVKDKRVHRFSHIVFLKQFLILDYRRLSVQKRCIYYFLSLFSKMALRIFLIFCMSFTMGPIVSARCFFWKILNPVL